MYVCNVTIFIGILHRISPVPAGHLQLLIWPLNNKLCAPLTWVNTGCIISGTLVNSIQDARTRPECNKVVSHKARDQQAHHPHPDVTLPIQLHLPQFHLNPGHHLE
jgi:hypothetical protein